MAFLSQHYPSPLFSPSNLTQHASNTSDEMIRDTFRYSAVTGWFPAGGPSTWYVTDWDARRIISVKMDKELDDDVPAIENLRRLRDRVPDDVFEIHVAEDGEIINMSSDPVDDQNHFVHYPLLEDLPLPEGIQTICRNKLEEVDRLGATVDLVTYPVRSNNGNKVPHFACQEPVEAWESRC